MVMVVVMMAVIIVTTTITAKGGRAARPAKNQDVQLLSTSDMGKDPNSSNRGTKLQSSTRTTHIPGIRSNTYYFFI